MGGLNNLWNKCFSPKQEKASLAEEEPEKFNVKQISVLISYLNAQNKIVKVMGYFHGDAYYDFYDNLVLICAKENLNNWLKKSVDQGVFEIFNKLIPRERVIEIHTASFDYWKEAE